MGKYDAIDQAASILEQFEISLRHIKDSPVRSATELPTAYQEGIALWKVLLDSNDADAKFEAYMKWMKILGH